MQAEGTWEADLLQSEEAHYLGEDLAPLFVYEALAADTLQHHPQDVWLPSAC